MFYWIQTSASASAMVPRKQNNKVLLDRYTKIIYYLFLPIFDFLLYNITGRKWTAENDLNANILQRDTITTVKNHNRNTALERSVISSGVGGC